MKKHSLIFFMAVSLLSITKAVHATPITISGTNLDYVGSSEIINVAFNTPNGGQSTNSYYGYVSLNVSGTGVARGSEAGDNFYVGTTNYGWYHLAIDDTALTGGSASFAQSVDNGIVYDFDAGYEVSPSYTPTYRADHQYHYVVDLSALGISGNSTLFFGVTDGNYSDNSGNYTVEITQLDTVTAQAPEPTSLLLFGAGILGLVRLNRKSKNML